MSTERSAGRVKKRFRRGGVQVQHTGEVKSRIPTGHGEGTALGPLLGGEQLHCQVSRRREARNARHQQPEASSALSPSRPSPKLRNSPESDIAEGAGRCCRKARASPLMHGPRGTGGGHPTSLWGVGFVVPCPQIQSQALWEWELPRCGYGQLDAG